MDLAWFLFRKLHCFFNVWRLSESEFFLSILIFSNHPFSRSTCTPLPTTTSAYLGAQTSLLHFTVFLLAKKYTLDEFYYLFYWFPKQFSQLHALRKLHCGWEFFQMHLNKTDSPLVAWSILQDGTLRKHQFKICSWTPSRLIMHGL
jgi:hypothetical protein